MTSAEITNRQVPGVASAATRPHLDALFNRIAPKRGRLIFAIDATASRQPTWDQAAHLQSEMFETAAKIGALDVQLTYFHGWGECRVSSWMSDQRALRSAMKGIVCKAGHTQIRKVLDHVRKEHAKRPIDAVVYVGDACEETPADLYEATCSAPIFLFQEGSDPQISTIFATLAKLTGGAHVEFNANSSVTLSELLKAVATFATGGVKALVDQNSQAARLLLTQIKK
jgi:hypothetical protein